MTEKVLLNSGYKYFKNETHRNCDKFYQKSLNKEDEFTKFINVYYYDKFKDNEALDYDFEYELVEEKDHYWKKTYLYALDDTPYTIEEIENILLGCEDNE